MKINLALERTRRSIGNKTEYCPYCGHVISFRDDVRFCRACKLPIETRSNEIQDAMEGRR